MVEQDFDLVRKLSCAELGKLCLAALWHDAAEAVIGDVVSPIKREVAGSLRPIELGIERAIEERFDLPEGHLNHSVIKTADIVAFCSEILCLAPESTHEVYARDIGFPLTFRKRMHPRWESVIPWPAELAFARFMDRHTDLMKRINL
jgi:hypothetical protein